MVTGYCRSYHETFPVTPDLHLVYYDNCTMAWCPVCAGHGERALHILIETWRPAFEQRETATVQVAASLSDSGMEPMDSIARVGLAGREGTTDA